LARAHLAAVDQDPAAGAPQPAAGADDLARPRALDADQRGHAPAGERAVQGAECLPGVGEADELEPVTLARRAPRGRARLAGGGRAEASDEQLRDVLGRPVRSLQHADAAAVEDDRDAV